MATLERRVLLLEQRGSDKQMESMVVVFGDEPAPEGVADEYVLRVVFVKPRGG